MSDFNIAYDITLSHEGGYVHDPNDLGGETYKGISRRFWPSWPGWQIIDQHKTAASGRQLQQALATDQTLQKMVRDFYYTHFWKPLRLFQLKAQYIANEMFDIAVNMNPTRAVRFAQEACNLTNRMQRDFPDIAVDGLIGPATIRTINNHPRPVNLFNTMNILQGMHYIDQARKTPSQQLFFNGWLSRVELMR